MSLGEVKGTRSPEFGAADVRAFLEQLRNRVLRVTTGMRPGQQRLELAIEAFWYAALGVTPELGAIPWRSFVQADHPLRNLLGPIRLMLRSELINSGIARPDPMLDDALMRMLEVAEVEGAGREADARRRDAYRQWLRATLRRAGHVVEPADLLHEAA